ncbi:hypothetical protein OK016_26235 [Vibrio chagasii]|nr:hypothetical protein [Vibrio chagasii]
MISAPPQRVKRTTNLLDATAFEKMKDGVMIANTSRRTTGFHSGYRRLKQSKIGALGS